MRTGPNLERLALAATIAPLCPAPLVYAAALAGWLPFSPAGALDAAITLAILLYLLALPAFIAVQFLLRSNKRWAALPAVGALIPFPVVVLLWFALGKTSADEENRAVWWSLLYLAPFMGAVSGLIFAAISGANRAADAASRAGP